MADDIGDIKSINTSSMALNTQAGDGAQKPMTKGGKDNPGDTKPPKPAEGHVPMPK